jgi:hypothetical protein
MTIFVRRYGACASSNFPSSDRRLNRFAESPFHDLARISLGAEPNSAPRVPGDLEDDERDQ